MKKMICLLGFVLMVLCALTSFSADTHTYQMLTATAWTSATGTPVIIVGTTPTANFSPLCNSLLVFENSFTCDSYIQFISRKNGTADTNGVWIPIPAGDAFFAEMTVPPGGIAVKVTSTANVSFISKK